MDVLEKELSSLRTIAQQLRVPELKYHQLGASTDSQIKDFTSLCLLLDMPRQDSNSLMPHVTQGDQFRQQPTLINTVFVADRIFDVWCRKLQLDLELIGIFDSWRFHFLKLIVGYLRTFENTAPKVGREVLAKYVKVVDELVGALQGWSSAPERSKGVVIDFLSKCSERLSNSFSGQVIDLNWLEEEVALFALSKSEKSAKVVSRLLNSEAQKIWSQYSFWYAQNYLDSVFAGSKMPESVQLFIDNSWIHCVRSQMNLTENGFASLSTEAVELTNALREVYCVQSESLFNLADSLIDNLKALTKKASVDCSEEIWKSLESSMVSLLKQEFNEHFHQYKSVALGLELAKQFGTFTRSAVTDKDVDALKGVTIEDVPLIGGAKCGYDVGDWYLSGDLKNQFRPMQIVKSFPYANLYLFVNHVGMKVGVFSIQELDDMNAKGNLRKLELSTSFGEVFENVLKGLKRVSDTQKKARLEAAEKAKREAERLLEEQKAAELEATRRAEEIAQRTKEIQKKREEKQLAEKLARALTDVQNLTVGAWIQIEGEFEVRFKLVVKIAASGKYIFVDKLGIKKKEYLEADLVNGFSENKIKCLSDGSDFEDSLQRVVSRIRQ